MRSPAADPASEAEAPNSFAWLRPVLLAGLWRHRWLLAAAAGAGVAAGMFRALVMPNQYQSVGKLFVRPGVRDSIAPDTLLSGISASSRSAGAREAVSTAMQVLAAPELFEKVAKRVGADAVLAPYDPAGQNSDVVPWHTSLFHTFQSWWFAAAAPEPAEFEADPTRLAALVLEHSLVIVPDPGASVILFSYVSFSPERAQRIVNAALDGAAEWHQEVFDRMFSLTGLEAEAKAMEAQAQAAEKVLREFRIEHGIDSYDTQRQHLADYITSLDEQLDRNGIDVKSLEAERTELAAQRSRLPARRVQVNAESTTVNPVYSSLSSILGGMWEAVYALDRAEGRDEDKVVAKGKLERQIQEVQAKLKTEPVQLRLEGIEIDNPDHVRVSQRLTELEVELKRLQAQRAQLGVVRDASRTRLAQIEAKAPELRRLEDDWQQKRAQADGLAASVSNMRALQRLEQQKLSNVRVMHYGTLEPEKIAPRRSSMLLYGVVGGAALGAALSVLLTLLDRRVRGRADLLRLELPPEGVLVAGTGAAAAATATPLPPVLADARDDIVRAWSALPYDRRATDPLKLAFLSCGDGADASRAAAALAIGLALHGGERVVHVSCTEKPSWLANRLGLVVRRGWTDVLRGELSLDQAMLATSVPGLDYLPAGAFAGATPHPLAHHGFLELLDRLLVGHRFVVVELPDLTTRPESRSVLGVVDAVSLVVRREDGRRQAVAEAVAAVKLAGARLLGAVLQPREGNSPAPATPRASS